MEQIYCYLCGLLQQVARSSSPSWQDSSWSVSVSLWAVWAWSLTFILILPILPIITCRFGCCEVIISDQGSKFVNKVKEELQQLTGTEHHVTSTYHPQSNRLTETFNQTLQTALIKVNQWYTRRQGWTAVFSVVHISNCPAEGNQDVTLIWGNVLQASASAYKILLLTKLVTFFPFYAVTENQCCP